MRSNKVIANHDRVRASQQNDLRDDAFLSSWFLSKPSETTLSVYVGSGLAYFAETKIDFQGQSTPIIVMPTTFPRIDNVCLDKNGDLIYTQGVESSNPEATKAETPEGNVPICEVYTRVGATSINFEDEDDGTNAYIRDIRGFFKSRRDKATEAEVFLGEDDFKLISPFIAKTYSINNSPDFFVTGTRSGHFSPRSLRWTNLATDGLVTIYRKTGVAGTYSVIGTANMSEEFYQDQEFVTGDLYYRLEVLIVADDPARPNIQYVSNVLYFSNQDSSVIETGDYGEGLDGAYTGGDLERGKIYQFTSFFLDSSMSFLDGGVTFIFVQENLEITTTGVCNFQMCATKDASRGTMTIAGNTGIDTVTGEGLPGRGGDGGSGDPDGNTGGRGALGYGGIGGIGNASGAGGNGTDGGGGGNGDMSGNGGDAGDVSGWQNKVIFIVGGNIIIKGRLNGEGFPGTDGQDAQGGGGAGAPGSNGVDLILLHGGTTYDIITAQLYLDGGAHGDFGVTTTFSGFARPQDGTAGSNGDNGDLYELLPI